MKARGREKRLKGEGIGVDDESQKQNRNKLQVKNAVALRQNQVDFGSYGRSLFQLQLFSFPFCHMNLAWGFATEAIKTADWVKSVGVRS